MAVEGCFMLDISEANVSHLPLHFWYPPCTAYPLSSLPATCLSPPEKPPCLPLALAKPSSPSLPSHLHKKIPHHTRQSSSTSTTMVSSLNPCSILPSLSTTQHSPAFPSTPPLTCSVPAQHPPPANQIPYNNSASSASNCPCHFYCLHCHSPQYSPLIHFACQHFEPKKGCIAFLPTTPLADLPFLITVTL